MGYTNVLPLPSFFFLRVLCLFAANLSAEHLFHLRKIRAMRSLSSIVGRLVVGRRGIRGLGVRRTGHSESLFGAFRRRYPRCW